MTTMIERVARALHESACQQDVSGYLDAKIDAGILARAAIEAMREPTERMLEVVISEPKHLYPDRSPDYAEKMKVAVMVERLAAVTRWQAMIDAVLNEGEGEQG